MASLTKTVLSTTTQRKVWAPGARPKEATGRVFTPARAGTTLPSTLQVRSKSCPTGCMGCTWAVSVSLIT